MWGQLSAPIDIHPSMFEKILLSKSTQVFGQVRAFAKFADIKAGTLRLNCDTAGQAQEP